MYYCDLYLQNLVHAISGKPGGVNEVSDVDI